jgi:Ni2+-binding GTPase involved in maturation of urease and hydrogenase
MNRTVLIPLGGFLGAGKTTLIMAASRVLHSLGKRPAAILNDQGNDLVDTSLVGSNGIAADQVAGGCFCCRFSDLIDAAGRLAHYEPDVIFAEAVGSCTDISATTLQPLKSEFGSRFQVAPYSVLVDPLRARDLLDGDSDLAFLFRKQIEEADLICFNKTDLYTDFPKVGDAPVRYISASTGRGVTEWLDEVLSGGIASGAHILDIDYERYARAEAALAWLNCAAVIHPTPPASPSMVVGPLLDRLQAGMVREGFEIAHMKVVDHCGSGMLAASVVRNGDEPIVRGALDASPAARHEMLLNIRAAGDPETLRGIVEQALAEAPGKTEVRNLACFSPAPPKPQCRFSHVVR